MSTYTIRIHGFWKCKADMFDENKVLFAKGELSHRRAQIEFLANKTRYMLTRHGFLRTSYQLMDDTGNMICRSLPKAGKYPLMLYSGSDTILLKLETHGIFNPSYIFYDDKNVEVARITKKGVFSREYELRISKLASDLTNLTIAVAIGTILFAIEDTAAGAAAASASSAATF